MAHSNTPTSIDDFLNSETQIDLDHSSSPTQANVNPVEKEKRKQRVVRSLRKERTTFSLQQALCIGLINEFCSITFAQPIKQSTVTTQFFRVKSLDFGDTKDVDVYRVVKNCCKQRYEEYIKKGVPQKTAVRRGQNNRKIEEIHYYQNILSEQGYQFKYSEGTNRNETHKLRLITEVWREGLQILDELQVPLYSSQVHSYLSSIMTRGDLGCMIEKNDKTITNYLVQYL